MTERLVIIGGDAAGMSAASQARRRRSPDELEIIAFERGPYASYSACGIPYFIGGQVEEADALIVRSVDQHRARDIDLRMQHEVIGIDLDARRVRVRVHADGAEYEEGFDRLLVATGAAPIRPPMRGIEAEGIFGVQTLSHGIAIRRWVDQHQPRRAVIMGSGYVGLEMAEAFTTRGIHTSVVEHAQQPLPSVDLDMGAMIADRMREMGIELYLDERGTGFESKNGRVRAVVTSEQTLPADVVVLGLGVRPNVDLAKRAGIPVGETDGIVVDEGMRTPIEGIWAAGDCVETYHRIARAPITIALGTHANKQGRVAGTTVTGGSASFGGVLGTAITKVCDVEIGRTGLGVADAAASGFDPVAEVVASVSRASYFPGAAELKVKVIADRSSARMIGAQIVGYENAGKRIDVFATALWNEMTVHDFAAMDLSYAPPFSPVWDPVLIAARKVSEQLSA